MKSITARKARQVDLRATQQLGISTLVMMENAGIRIADFVLKILANKPKKKIAVLCGKGNNAGDGLVVARQLLCEGRQVDTFLLAPVSSLSLPARRNLDILRGITKNIYQINTQRNLYRFKFNAYYLLIDAILGLGLKGRVEGIFETAIQMMNASGALIISVDVPSGLDANQGKILGIAVKADYTVSLIAPKRGFLVNQGPRCVGKLITKHIGFPVN